ncbi:triphosphoribosyl-dephospho-CoA synthase [Halolamina litorea]|uniref:Triphosphoribosyl-dephospho-CoA synthase n=1 Tax=Halolamina litorea TaxID=1515593 RepID=A0ABD6BSR6_9EURY|nr:triphosphoribosyl-dephospho-CoA synthase [Halolamina litorea]
MSRPPGANAELALLLELSGTPKPGNVDRQREYADLTFEQFLAGAVGARAGLDDAADGAAVGDAFETAVAGMARQDGGNTQFGALLLLTPLVRAAATDRLTPDGAAAVVDETTVDDAAGFYRAFDHVDVFVDEPPDSMDDLDVRRGSDAVPALRERGLTLADVMAASAPADGVAAEWTAGFERTFAAAASLLDADGPLSERVPTVFLDLLAAEPDSLIAKRHGESVAAEVTERAAELQGADPEAVTEWADELVADGINPGTTADVTAAALFVALERGLAV